MATLNSPLHLPSFMYLVHSHKQPALSDHILETSVVDQLNDSDELMNLLSTEENCTAILQNISTNEQFQRLMNEESEFVPTEEIEQLINKTCRKPYPLFPNLLQLSLIFRPNILTMLKLGKHQCQECFKCFKNVYHLRSHLLTHDDKFPYKCPHCDKRCKRKQELKSHSKVHNTNRDTYTCEVCHKKLTSKTSLIIHHKRHQKLYTIFCEYCKKGFYTKTSLTLHTNSKHEGKSHFVCEICGRQCYDKTSLENHRMKHDANYGKKKNIKCTLCDTRFIDEKFFDPAILTRLLYGPGMTITPIKQEPTDLNFTVNNSLKFSHFNPFNGLTANQFQPPPPQVPIEIPSDRPPPAAANILDCLNKKAEKKKAKPLDRGYYWTRIQYTSKIFTYPQETIQTPDYLLKIQEKPSPMKKNLLILDEDSVHFKDFNEPSGNNSDFNEPSGNDSDSRLSMENSGTSEPNGKELEDVKQYSRDTSRFFRIRTSFSIPKSFVCEICPRLVPEIDPIRVIELYSSDSNHNSEDNSSDSNDIPEDNPKDSDFALSTEDIDTESDASDGNNIIDQSIQVGEESRKTSRRLQTRKTKASALPIPNPLVCKICIENFTNIAPYALHMRQHAQEESLKCFICKSPLGGTADDIEFHIRAHQDVSRVFIDVTRIDHNENRKSSIVPLRHRCPSCGKSFILIGRLFLVVKKEPTVEEYVIEIFPALSDPLETQRVVNEMISTPKTAPKHKLASGAPFCNRCQTYYADPILHALHTLKHSNGLFDCPTCPLLAKMTEEQVETHVRIHEENPKHTCPKCGLKLYSDSTAIKHEKSHFGMRKPLPCGLCEATFLFPCTLSAHETTEHGDVIEEFRKETKAKQEEDIRKKSVVKEHLPYANKPLGPVLCQYCNETFRSNIQYGYHLTKFHSLDEKFKCFLCKSPVRMDEARMENHLRRHEFAQTFKCSVCGEGFCQRQDAEDHERFHEEKGVECNLCDSEFLFSR
ncbi:unnamed protein product [Phaedon cochleariae]|uniref:C2H2-type domain-containing protein n=1 Tax=Phaedon cochleariae TaxID=80249 RepID=A0A9N9SE95_PHACE|nr:unnamed protein product [Phaedon cochleariae]